ncbi:MAG: hypothetical protein IJY35_01055, partial [Clostridia bacterium]|nr:hypothetical protein [Clostridia bacterium]
RARWFGTTGTEKMRIDSAADRKAPPYGSSEFLFSLPLYHHLPVSARKFSKNRVFREQNGIAKRLISHRTFPRKDEKITTNSHYNHKLVQFDS